LTAVGPQYAACRRSRFSTDHSIGWRCIGRLRGATGATAATSVVVFCGERLAHARKRVTKRNTDANTMGLRGERRVHAATHGAIGIEGISYLAGDLVGPQPRQGGRISPLLTMSASNT